MYVYLILSNIGNKPLFQWRQYAGQPLKANCASHAEGLAPLLCALSSASRVYISQGLSTRTALFMDRHPNGAYVPPTNPSVATLMRTVVRNTSRCHCLIDRQSLYPSD